MQSCAALVCCSAFGPTLPGGNGDFVFEENMVFSLDMPYYEIGWGNLHMEDQILVTANGVEPLTNCDTSLRIRPATPYDRAKSPVLTQSA